MKTKKILSLLLASIMLLGLITVPATAADDTPAYYDGANPVVDMSFSDEIDGRVEEDTWGEPTETFTYADDLNGTTKQDNWTFVNNTKGNVLNDDGSRVYLDQSVELYVRRGESGVYLAVKLINAIEHCKAPATDSSGKNIAWPNRAGLDVAIGTYDETYNVKRDNGAELFRTYRLYERYNGTSWTKVEEHPKQNGVEQSGYALTSFAIGFEDTTSTYTYELLIPYDETHILKYHDLVLSFAVRDAYVSTVNSTNAYNISDVCRATTYQGYGSNDAAAVYGDERTLPFYRLNPLRIRINDDRYVKDHAAEMPNTAPTINGEVSVTEWGNPVVVTNSEYANDMWDSGHVLSDKANYNPKQRAKVWLTNDNDFIYVAATLDHEDPGDSWTPTDRNHPRFVILLSQKGAGNGPVLVEGKDQYTRLGIGFKDDATATLNDKTYANIASALMDSSKLSRAAKFEQGTYTYELKIPFAMTNIEFKDSTEIAVSILICGANHDGVNNRYNIGGTGCSKSNTNSTNAQDQCLIMTLNDVQNPEAAIDGINYPTLEAALDAATSGQTVTLLDNVTADEIMVNNGVTLDLAGHALTASTVIANVGVGQIVDSSIGEGIIKITKNSEDVANLLLTKDHGTLPLYDAQDGGYRFFTPTFESQERESGDTNKRIFGIRVGLPSEKAYDLLDDTDNYKVLSIKLVLTKDGDTQPTTIDHAFKQTTVEEYVSESLKDLNKKKGIMLTVTGLDVAAEAGITVTATASMAVANETVEKAY